MKAKIRDPKRAGRIARRARVRSKVAQGGRVQLKIYRSARHMYAQLFDPSEGRTITAVSTRSPAIGGLASTGGIEAAKKVGQAIAAAARERNIEQVVFNRNGFLYHGRVKAVADAAREAGLQF